MAARRGAYGPDTLDQARLAALNLAAAEGRKSAGTLGMTPTGASAHQPSVLGLDRLATR